jgi:pimeloyl-ACP methyl ester carboxylesterase
LFREPEEGSCPSFCSIVPVGVGRRRRCRDFHAGHAPGNEGLRYRAGDRAGAVDIFARGVFGSDYRGPLERGLPGAFEQAVADADAFFTQEMPALQQWSFSQADAARITQPTLAIRGENTAPTFPERLQLLVSWLPNGQLFELPNATHLLHLQNAQGMAEALASFYAQHPLAASSA